MRRLSTIVALAALTGCAPPSVKVVEAWLAAYGADDTAALKNATLPADRELLETCLAATSTSPMSRQALALPPKPLRHEFLEIEKKEGTDRQVLLVKMELKNPLHYEAKRVGQSLPNIPKTRWKRRRFLSVKEGENWYVKLDLATVLERAHYAERFLGLITARRLKEAEAMLESIPERPDDGDARRTKKDNLEDALKLALEKAKKRRAAAKAKAKKVKTSSTSTTSP